MFDVVNPTYKEIIQTIEESSIARFFLSMEYGKKYKSLFREDDVPSASLYYSANSRLRYNDFIHNLSMPDAVMKLKGWDYNQFLENVSKHYGIVPGNISNKSTSVKNFDLERHLKNVKETIISIKRRAFSVSDLDYWRQFGIRKETLELFNVFSISHFWVSKDGNSKLINGSKYCYSYDFYWEDNIFRRKIYQPFKKEVKWYSNGGKICQGEINMPNFGDLLIITKSLKDVMTLFELGYVAVAPPSESVFLPEEYFIKQRDRFKRIVLWYDNDFDKNVNVGLNKSVKFSEEYGIEYIYIPSEYKTKDISDFVKEHGVDKAKLLIEKLLSNNE